MSGILQFLRLLQGLIVLALAGVFTFNLYSDLKNLNVTTQSLSVETKDSLVPPAITLCINTTQYSFNITLYGQPRANSGLLTTYDSDSAYLTGFAGVLTKCWILSSGNSPIIQNPPPVQNVPDMVLTYTRVYRNQNDTTSPIWLNVFDPLEISTLFSFNRFLELDADQNHAIIFTRTQHTDINGVKRNDVLYNIVQEFRDPSWTVPGQIATSKITIRAGTFDIQLTNDSRKQTWWGVFADSLTLIGILFGYYITIVGRGRYAPWGLIHHLFRYYPIEHVQHHGLVNEAEGFVTKEGRLADAVVPTTHEKLGVYLSRFERAKYHV